jgi:hypothetical protein
LVESSLRFHVVEQKIAHYLPKALIFDLQVSDLTGGCGTERIFSTAHAKIPIALYGRKPRVAITLIIIRKGTVRLAYFHNLLDGSIVGRVKQLNTTAYAGELSDGLMAFC